MLKEVIGYLNLKPGSVVLDATIGGGGHAKEILKMILPGGRLIGLDADSSAIRRAEEALSGFAGSFKLINGNFKNLDNILAKENIKSLDAALFDIGLSSFQLDDGSRGFSINQAGRLDMRMDTTQKVSAYEIVNKYKERELSDMIERFGEERFHKKIAAFIVAGRAEKPIDTTTELAGIVRRAVGYRHKGGGIDPATRTFQAIRIVVNNELAALEEGLKKSVSWLRLGARVAVISFHSLEDRIAKRLFRDYAGLGVLKIITKKPVRPSREEVLSNPRSRSGRLRIAERI